MALKHLAFSPTSFTIILSSAQRILVEDAGGNFSLLPLLLALHQERDGALFPPSYAQPCPLKMGINKHAQASFFLGKSVATLVVACVAESRIHTAGIVIFKNQNNSASTRMRSVIRKRSKSVPFLATLREAFHSAQKPLSIP